MYERTYHSKVLSQNEPKEKKRRRRIPIKKILWLFVGVVMIAGIIVLIRLPGLQIREIDVTGANVTDPQDVSVFLHSQIEGNALYFFPRSSMLLVPTATLGKRVQAQFPRFASVDVRRIGLNGLLVTVTEHEGTYLWCQSQEECFFMTNDGIVFAQAPFFSGDAYERIFYGERGELPFSPLPDHFRALIDTMRERLPSIGIVPDEYSFESEHRVDIVFSHRGVEARLMIDPTNDIEQTVEDLATALATDPLKTQFNDKNKVLEYLDARFANKVVFKFR